MEIAPWREGVLEALREGGVAAALPCEARIEIDDEMPGARRIDVGSCCEAEKMLRLDAMMVLPVGVPMPMTGPVRFVTAMLVPVRAWTCIFVVVRVSAPVLVGRVPVPGVATMLVTVFVSMMRLGARSGRSPRGPDLDRLLSERFFLRCGRQHETKTANHCNRVTHGPLEKA